uniref:Receptor expression-enhancing protein n=1 Tax=Euplotes harpa TaxID=151035 RepID=A0A7S3JCP2_9SPIT|mmetsp:Transcript_2770/g.3446  ORF Transcript_2770/g.3446 Transcript_2770/m.3446 type:complete len:159 (+) Transcript_2770:2-478(+)
MDKIEPYIELISSKTGVKTEYVRYGLLSGFILIFALGFGASLIANIVGVFYPAFQSFLALEKGEFTVCKKWLTYWVVFATFSILDHFASFILVWIPFYFLFKLVFLAYLFFPITDGAGFIYENYVRVYFKKYEAHIDEFAKKYEEASKLRGQAKSKPE